jgi:hypothetical protein
MLLMHSPAMSGALTDWELLARAGRVRRQHGESAVRFIADRIGEYLMAGDEDGARTWRAIEDGVRKLNRGGSLS